MVAASPAATKVVPCAVCRCVVYCHKTECVCRLLEGPRLASFVAWALPRAAGVKELTVRFTNHHQAMKFQVQRQLLNNTHGVCSNYAKRRHCTRTC